MVDAVHFDQLREHGGLRGIRDENALESALARARNRWALNKNSDLSELAAAYGFGLAANHLYRDGKKRIAFLTMLMFLGLNGHSLDASETEVVTTMLAVAAKQYSEKQLAAWVRRHMVRR